MDFPMQKSAHRGLVVAGGLEKRRLLQSRKKKLPQQEAYHNLVWPTVNSGKRMSSNMEPAKNSVILAGLAPILA